MMKTRRVSGFTMIELCIALALMGILFVKLTLILNQASKVSQTETVSIALEDQAAVLLDRIAYAVIGSDPDRLTPDNESPFFSDRINFTVSLGVEDGQVIWNDEEVIGLAADPSKLYWAKNEGLPAEQVVIWCRDRCRVLRGGTRERSRRQRERTHGRVRTQLRGRGGQRDDHVDARTRRPGWTGAFHEVHDGHLPQLIQPS